MISGKLRIDGLYSLEDFSIPFDNTPTICQSVESLYGLTYGGYGVEYRSNGSWVGINAAAICTGGNAGPSGFGGIYGRLQMQLLARIGLGLVVEIDLARLPETSLDNCSFTVAGEVGVPPSNSIDPSNIHIRATGVSGNSGFISIGHMSEEGNRIIPQPWYDNNHYVIQGICVK